MNGELEAILSGEPVEYSLESDLTRPDQGDLE